MSPYLVLVCILISLDFSKGMRSMRGMRVAAPDPQQGAPIANHHANDQALNNVMQNDPCLNLPINGPYDADHPAEVSCRRAMAAFSSRNEEERARCRFAIQPKCRRVSGDALKRCSVKKLRPRSHLICLLIGTQHEIVPLAYCAQPLFPNFQGQGHAPVIPNPVV